MTSNRNVAVHLTISNNGGSVEHYYHFFLGFLVPLVDWYSRFEGEDFLRVYIRSCATMDSFILELGYHNLVILDKEHHMTLSNSTEIDNLPCQLTSIPGFDSPKFYSKQVFDNARLNIQHRLNINSMNDARHVPTHNVILIGRRPPDPFYLSSKAEIKGAGTDRRSIPNCNELCDAIASWSPSFLYLEDLSLQQKILAFVSADVIIAQLGAGVANILFCRPGTTLILIVPWNHREKRIKYQIIALISILIHGRIRLFIKEILTGCNFDQWFLPLALLKDMHFVSIRQSDNHAPVEPTALVRAMKTIL